MVDLHLDGVRVVYGGRGGLRGGRGSDATEALRGVDIDVADGEFFTLVGPSGCGKTTTLRVVAGFEEPTDGVVRFGDRSMAGVPPEDRDVGLVFQNYALFPNMTVRENVAYGLRFRDPPGGVSSSERVRSLLEMVDMAGMGGRDPASLSGGQQQRVALARALAPGPDLLLLDEPMSALDADLRKRLRRTVSAIQSDLGITTLYVTHDQAEALAISDRLAVLSDGRVEQVGTPRAVYRRPATPFVARFVGENNCFRGRLRGDRTSVSTGTSNRQTAADSAVEAEGFEADGSRDGAGGTPTVDVDGTVMTVAGVDTAAREADEASAESPADGDAVLVCVRPEDLTVGGGRTTLDVTVESWEFLGEAVRVHCSWGDHEVVLRSRDPPEADTLTVGFDPGDAYVIRTE